MIGVGAMIGAGIFVLTGIAAGVAGPAIMVAFLLNGIVAIFTASAYAELGGSIPEAGGGYLWVKTSLPQPTGFLSGWMSWMAHSVACSLYAVGFGAYFGEVLVEFHVPLAMDPILMKKLLAVIVVLLFALINYRGAKETGRAGNVVTVLKILIILLFVVLGSKIILFDRQPPSFDNFVPFFPHGFLGVLTAMGLTYIAFEGYEIIAQSGEEIKDPKRNIPKAIFYSLLIVVPIYLLVSFVALGVVHPQGMTAWDYLAAKKEIAMVEAARSISAWGSALLLIGGLLSTLSALNATIYSSSRVSFAMGRDHNLPEVFSRVHPRHKTPSGSLLISSTLIIVILLLLPIEDIASSADVMFLLLFIFVNVALIHIRSKHPGRLKGYRSPLFPLMPVLGIITQGMLIVVMFIYSPKSFFTSMLWIGAGLSIYYAYSRFKEKEEVGPEVVLQEKELAHKKFKLVLGVEEEREIRPLMNIAIPIAREKDAEIFVVHVISLPPQTPLHVGKELIEERRGLLEIADRIGEQHDIPVSFTLRVSHRTYQGIIDSVVESKGNLLILGSGKIGPRRRLLGSILDPLLQEVPCDVGILKVQDGSKVKKILVPAAGGPNAELAFELGWSIVKQNGGKLTLLNIIHNEAKRGKGEEILKRIRKGRRQGKGKIEEKVVLGSDVLQTILQESERYDLILMGASRLGLWKRVRFGTVPEKLMRSSPVPVLFIRKYEGRILSWLRRFIAG
jgi:amino acid transporter